MRQQSLKLGKQTGSLINHLMSANETLPTVGKGGTIFHWSDRSCFEVIEVSQDMKTVRCEMLNAEADLSKQPLSEGHQEWILKPSGNFFTLVYKKDGWYQESKEVVFTSQFLKEMTSLGVNFIGLHLRKTNPTLADQIYQGHVMPSSIIEGITREKKSYSKINVYFGSKDYHYDWTF